MSTQHTFLKENWVRPGQTFWSGLALIRPKNNGSQQFTCYMNNREWIIIHSPLFISRTMELVRGDEEEKGRLTWRWRWWRCGAADGGGVVVLFFVQRHQFLLFLSFFLSFCFYFFLSLLFLFYLLLSSLSCLPFLSFSPFSFTIFLLVFFVSASISLLFLSCFSLSQNLPPLPVSHPLVFIKGERGDSHPTLSNRA